MKRVGHEYEEILEFLIKKGTASKYAIAKGAAIPYSTVLRKLPEMEEAHLIRKIGEGKRGAEIYSATPKGTLIAYFNGRVRTSELFMALPGIMKYVQIPFEELPAVKDPFGFLIGELPFKLSQLDSLGVEEAISILGAILIWRHDEWYHELGKEELKRLLVWKENYLLLRALVAGSRKTLQKLNEQAMRLTRLTDAFLTELDELAGRH